MLKYDYEFLNCKKHTKQNNINIDLEIKFWVDFFRDIYKSI